MAQQDERVGYLARSNVLIVTLATSQQGMRQKQESVHYYAPLKKVSCVCFFFPFLTFTFTPSLCRKQACGYCALPVAHSQQSDSLLMLNQKSYVAVKHAKATEAKRKE